MDKRVDIKTGFLCNNNCFFCVQAHNKLKGNRPKEEIFSDLSEAKKTGCTGVVFTGGEVSIRPDFLELLAEAKRLHFETIQVQTNARRFSYPEFALSAVKAGMNEFAPALHGHIPELHDYLTRCPGSFEQTRKGIVNVKKLGLRVVTNSVVVKPNYRYLPELARLLVSLGVDQYQFAFVHPMGNAITNIDSMVPWVSLAAPFIHQGLQVGIDNGVRVMAEAMPYCMMPGYEKYVSELYIPPTEIRTAGSFDPHFEKTRKESGKVKFPQCKECRFDSLCEGPWREYPDRFGNEEFRPVKGAKITDPKLVLNGQLL